MRAGQGADDHADKRREPLNPQTFEAVENDPRAGSGLEQDDAAARTGDASSEEGHTPEHITALDAVGGAELAEVVWVPTGEEKGGDRDDTAAGRSIEAPKDAHSQEVPIADHAQPPTRDQGKMNGVPAADEALPSTAEIEPYTARSGDNLAIKLPNDDRSSEVLITEHGEGSEPPQIPLGTLVGQQATQNDQHAGTKSELTIALPNDPRYREVLVAENVEGFGASLGRHGGGPPRQALDGLVAATGREQDPDPEDVFLSVN